MGHLSALHRASPPAAIGTLAPAVEERVVRPIVVPMPAFGVVVFESRHGPGFSGQLQDDFSKFLLIVAGSAKWETSGRQIQVTTDSLVHIPAGLPHRQEDSANDPLVLYVIHYRPNVLPEFLRSSLAERGLVHWPLGSYLSSEARSVRSNVKEMLFEQGAQRDGWEWLLCARLVEIAVRAMRIGYRGSQAQSPVFVKGMESGERVSRYALQLQTRFYLRQSLDEAAAAVGLSRRQFTAVFRKVSGQSWKKHVLSLRLHHARKLLLNTDKTVTAAAFESGFDDLSYFDRSFKRAFACSPQAIRQSRSRSPAAG